jgi:chromate transporter
VIADVLTLGRVFAYLSLITLGGGISAYPELNTLAVDTHGWLTASQLDYLFGVGQAAPGPNLVSVAIGAATAGLPGALVVLVAFVGPPALLAFVVGRTWTRLRAQRWVASLQRALTPVSIGLLLAGCLTFAKGAITDWMTFTLAAIVFVVVMRTRVNPALMVLAGAVAGILAFAVA